MTRARNFADVISGQFDLPVGALDNVPAADLVNDTTPQLGGNLDGQTNNITNVGSVGIGTNSPTGDLEVESSSATNGLVRMGQLQFKNSSGNHTQNTDGVHIFPFSDGNMYHDNYDGGYVWRTGAAVERMRVDSNGISVPSGSGINFSATANTSVTGASMQGELLDDYETGTWTPVIGGSTTTGTASYSTQLARYTKVGNLVTLIGYVNWANLNGTGNLVIYNIPFITSETGNHYEALAGVSTMHSAFSLSSGYTDVCLYYPAYSSNDYIFFYQTGPSKSWTNVGIQANAQVIFTFTYTTA
mgnify:CR=1 FL=1